MCLLQVASVNNSGPSISYRYFSQIDERLLTEVLEIYQLDFELFGYNSTKYYSYVQESIDDG